MFFNSGSLEEVVLSDKVVICTLQIALYIYVFYFKPCANKYRIKISKVLYNSVRTFIPKCRSSTSLYLVFNPVELFQSSINYYIHIYFRLITG